MAAKGTMKISVIGDASKFDRAMNNVQSKLSKVGSAVAKFGKVAAAGIAGAGAAAVAGAFKMADYANEVDRAARESGMAAEKIQVTAQAMERLGVDRERAVDGMRELNLRLGEAATEGGDAAEGFKTLGIKMRDAEGNIRSSGAVMDEVMAKLGNMPNQADRAAAAAKIFGDEAGFAFAGVAAEGDKLEQAMGNVRESGAVMSEKGIAQAQKFQKGWESLKQSALGLLQNGLTPLMGWMASSLFPFIQNKIVPALSKFREWLGPKLSSAADTVGTFFRTKVQPALRALGDWWDSNGSTIMQTARGVRDAAVDMARKIGRWVDEHLLPPLHAFGELVTSLLGGDGDIRSDISGFVAWLGPFWKEHGNDIFQDAKHYWTTIKDEIESLLGQAKVIIKGITGAISGDWSGFLDTLQKDFDAFDEDEREEWESFMSGIRTTLLTMSDLMALDWQTALARMRGETDEHVAAHETNWSDHSGKLKSIASGAYSIIKGDWNSALTTMKEDLLGWDRDIFEIWDDFWDGVRDSAIERGEELVEWFDDLPQKIIDAIGDLGSTVGGWISEQLGGLGDIAVKVSGSIGDGPGMQVPSMAGGGSAMDMAQRVMRAVPGNQYITSAYRTPAENERVGGSPTSYHLDKTNPAVDIGGQNLDMVFAALKQMGVPRELLGPPNAADHQDHVHVAHSGGTVGRDRMRNDEVMAKLRLGETVLPEGLAEMYATHVERLKGHLAELGGMRGSARTSQLERLAAHHEKLVERRQGWHEQRLGRVESFLSDLTRAHRSGHRDVLDVTDRFGDRLHSKHRRTTRRLDGLWESFLDRVERATKNMMQDASSGFSSPSFDGPSDGSDGADRERTKPKKSEKDRIRERVEALRAMRERGVDLTGSEEELLDKHRPIEINQHFVSSGDMGDDAQKAKLKLMS